MSPIANYTTKIEAERTIGEINVLLRKWKVRESSIRWDDDGTPIAVWFTIPTAWGDRSYVLPAHVDGVWAVLRRTVNAKADRAHAARVAWRTVQDWLQAQLAMIEAGAGQLEQVMLPYLEVSDSQTVFQWFESKYKALPAGSTAADVVS